MRCFVKRMKHYPALTLLAALLLAALASRPAFGQDLDSLMRREALLSDEAERYVSMALRDGLIGERDADSLRQKCRIQAGDGVRLTVLQNVIQTIDNLYESAFSAFQEPMIALQLDKALGSRMLPGILTLPEDHLTTRERRQLQEAAAVRRMTDDLAEAVALPELRPIDHFFLHVARYFFNHHPENYGKEIPMNGGIYTIRVPEMPHLPGGKELSTNTYEMGRGSK